MLRIASKAETVDKFIRVFSHFCDRESFFIVTRKPKETGTETRFAIHLQTGEPVISGMGRVAASYDTRDNPYKLPGMKLRFVELYGKSAEVIERLVAAKESSSESSNDNPQGSPSGGQSETDAALDKLLPSTPLPSAPPTIPAGVDPVQVALAEAKKVAAVNLQGERVKGSDFILPANPFGELTDDHLEAFIECSMYEDATKKEEQDDAPADDMPAWWPERASVRSLTTGPVTTFLGEPTNPGLMGGGNPSTTGATPHLQPAGYSSGATPPPGIMPGGAPRVQIPTPAPLPVVGPASGVAAHAPQTGAAYPAGVTAQAVAEQDTPAKRSATLIIIIAMAVTALLTLGVGYLLWGGGSDDKNRGVPSGENAPASQVAPDTASGSDDTAVAHGEENPLESGDPNEGGDADVANIGDAPNDDDDDDDGAQDSGQDDTTDGVHENVTLAPGECLAVLHSDPEGADVFLNDKKLGITPVDVALPCGAVELTFKKPRRMTMAEKTTLIPDQPNPVNVRLDRPKVTLVVSSIPPKGMVKVNGKSLGQTPVTIDVAAFRALTLEVSKSGYVRYKEKLTPKDEKMNVRARLKRARR